MDVPFTGGCACGAIRYTCAGAPRDMGNCHCRDCQQATGSAYLPCVLVNDCRFGQGYSNKGLCKILRRPTTSGRRTRSCYHAGGLLWSFLTVLPWVSICRSEPRDRHRIAARVKPPRTSAAGGHRVRTQPSARSTGRPGTTADRSSTA